MSNNYPAFTFEKDPNAKLDYQINWATWLGSDTLKTVTWNVPTGITKESQTETTTTATIWLSGGTDKATYLVTCHVVTNSNREEDCTIAFKMRPK